MCVCVHTAECLQSVFCTNADFYFYFFCCCFLFFYQASSLGPNITLEGLYHCHEGPGIPLDKLCDFSADCPLGDDEGELCREYKSIRKLTCPLPFMHAVVNQHGWAVGLMCVASNEAVASCPKVQQLNILSFPDKVARERQRKNRQRSYAWLAFLTLDIFHGCYFYLFARLFSAFLEAYEEH